MSIRTERELGCMYVFGNSSMKLTFQTRRGIHDSTMPVNLTYLDSEVLDSTETPQQETPRQETPRQETPRTCTTFQTRRGLSDSTMLADLTSSDSEVLDSTETPQQETHQTCTRKTPCTKPICYTCSSPSNGNHVQNLTTALNMITSTAIVNSHPAPPTNHWISELTRSFQDAILIYHVRDLKHLNAFYDRCMVSDPDILKFDRSQLLTTLKHAQKIIDSSIPPSSTPTQVPNPPPPINHWISELTSENQDAILRDDFVNLKLFTDLYAQKFLSEPDVLEFHRSDLRTAQDHALKIINSSFPVPNSNSPSPTPTPAAQLTYTPTPANHQTHTHAALQTIYLGTTPNSKTSNPTSVAALGLGIH